MGSSSYLTNSYGVPSHYYNYLPFGEVSVSQNQSEYNNVYRFSTKELDDETQLSYFGARYYDARLSYWLSVDPLWVDYVTISPYSYVANNPVKYIDPNGESIGVKQKEDGTYEVVKGNPNDKDRGVYLLDKDGNYDINKSKKIGTTKTSHSFFDSENKIVSGAIIDLKSNEGQEFLDKLIQDDPSLFSYMLNATNGEKYDLKDKGIEKKNKNNTSELQHRYRGSVDNTGEIGSARDFGNMGAGLVAARKGLTWKQARIGFDLYQGFTSYGIVIVRLPRTALPTVLVPLEREATTTVKAQMVGNAMGIQRFQRSNLKR